MLGWRLLQVGSLPENLHRFFFSWPTKLPGDEVQRFPLKECQEGEVHFGESAWSFPMILGLTTASSWDIIFAILLLLLNFGMQVMFSYIIMGPSFTGSDFKGEVLSAQRWRERIAHDYKYMDLKQTSLATRVCSGDGALILSTVQATLVNQINSSSDFGGSLSWGPIFSRCWKVIDYTTV